MFEKSDGAEQREADIAVEFYEGSDKEPIAVVSEGKKIPIPSEDERVVLSDLRPEGEISGEPDVREHDDWTGEHTLPPRRVLSVTYEYDWMSYPDAHGNNVEQLYTTVKVRFEDEDDTV